MTEARGIQRGTSAYRRVTIAFFLAGFSTFSLLYCVQPLLPLFARDFGVSPAQSSLALSLSTVALALAILAAAMPSEKFGRRNVMLVSMIAAAILNFGTALAPNWHLLLIARALEGFALGGVPAVAMAYLAEEIAPRGLGFAMGLFVSGNAFGGMIGRVSIGILAERFGWRWALAAIGIAGLASAAGFFTLLPPSRNFVPRRDVDFSDHLRAWLGHLRRPELLTLFAIGFLSMGAFVAVYNYVGFRLMGPPYYLNQSEIGPIFTVYLFGIVTSPTAGALSDRIGRDTVLPIGIVIFALGVSLTLLSSLMGVIAGIIILTIGFFATYSVASSWVGQLARTQKGHASALYLLFYYSGSSVLGSVAGWFYTAGGWPTVATFLLILLLLAGLAALYLFRLAPSLRLQAVSGRENAPHDKET